MRYLIYTTGNPFNQPQTGGDKRFEELAIYACNKWGADFCGAVSESEAQERGLRMAYEIKPATGWLMKLPPVLRICIQNFTTIRAIKKAHYDRIIVFDVPVAFTLCIYGLTGTVLMIRKDLIGYERFILDGNSLRNSLKIVGKQWLETICLIRSTTIITQCEYDKQALLERHPFISKIIASKFLVQINNINPSWIVKNAGNNAKQESAREISEDTEEKRRLSDNYFDICFVGNFDHRRKGHDLILPVMICLKHQYKNIRLHVIGGGRDLEKYREKYECEQIKFYGRTDNPESIIRQSDLMVVPSFADSCPNTVLEALYLGVPVIGSKRGGIPEILLDEDALFDVNIDSLKGLIKKLYLQPQSLSLLAEHQRKRAKELNFNWAEKIMKMIENKE